MARGWMAIGCVTALACGPTQWPSPGDALSIGEDTESESEPLTHDVIKVQFARSEAAPDTPYIGTSQIEMTMTYDSCFSDFYEQNPNWTIEGVDGALVFGSVDQGGEAWQDRLCQPPDATQVPCTIIAFEQELEVAKQLTVTYAVSDDPENRFLKFGPLPLVDEIPAFVCEAVPRMQINPQQIRGRDANDVVIWEGEALDEDLAAAGQGKAVVVKASRND